MCIIVHIETEIITEKGLTDANLKEMFSSIVNGHTQKHTHARTLKAEKYNWKKRTQQTG